MPDIRILHVDDESDVRLLVEASLGLDPGLVTQSCASGAEALAIAAQWRPDLILLDATMPDMDGPATLAQLKDDPRTSGIPVIFLTASCQNSDVDRFKSIGSAGVIAKPFDPRALAASVRGHAQAPDPDPATANPSLQTLRSPSGATADAGLLGQVVSVAGTSMASGLSEATAATPGDAGAIVLFDANGHALPLPPGDRWDGSRVLPGMNPSGPLGAPTAFTDGHDTFTVSTWNAGTMLQTEAVTLLDIDTSQRWPVGASLAGDAGAVPGAIGSGLAGIGDHASGYHAGSDLIHASLGWAGSSGGLAAGMAGSEIWGVGASGTMLHDLKLLR